MRRKQKEISPDDLYLVQVNFAHFICYFIILQGVRIFCGEGGLTRHKI